MRRPPMLGVVGFDFGTKPAICFAKLPGKGPRESNAAAGEEVPPTGGGCWAVNYVDRLWPEEIPRPDIYNWASANAGWYWHNFCHRYIRYLRDVGTGALSYKTVFTSYEGDLFDTLVNSDDPEYFNHGSLPTGSSWYDPSEADVENMIAYAPPGDCSGSPTATMEVMIEIKMYRERKWTNPFPPGPWAGWDERTDETGSWPYIIEVAWRYI